MRLRPSSGLAWAAAWLALTSPALGASARKNDDSKTKTEEQEKSPTPWVPRPILLVANEVIKKALRDTLLDAPSDHGPRISVKDGLVGLGAYTPRGGADYGMKSPPRYLFPQVGLGNSLNVDPYTGHSYFTNTP